MKITKLCVAVLAGFLLGAIVFRMPGAKANAQDAGTAHVFIVPVRMLDAKNAAPHNLPGVKVAGISCIPKPETKFPDAVICYVATSLATP